MNDTTQNIAAEYSKALAKRYGWTRWVEGEVEQDIQSAIEKATEAAITRITMDEESWGGIKLEWRQDEHRIYAYSANGAFLWSGSPSHAVWSCIRHSRAAHASEQGEIATEVGIIREVLKTLIVWIAQSSVGVISADNAKQLIDKLETNRI